MKLWRRFRHLFGHRWSMMGYSYLGNAVERCAYCNQCAVLQGNRGLFRNQISLTEARRLVADSAMSKITKDFDAQVKGVRTEQLKESEPHDLSDC